MRLLLAGICLAVLTASAAAQGTASAAQTRPTFEVASIRLNTSGSPRGGADAAPNGRVFVSNTSLYDLIRQGFELQRQEMVSGDRLPSWVESEKWDIVAQGPPIADQASQRQLRVMLQNLLVDRFKLVTRREVRDIPVYALVFARSDRRLGPQIQPSTIDCAALLAAAAKAAAPGTVPVCGRDSGAGFINVRGVPLADFLRTLSAFAGRVVIDGTGLTDRFDLTLKWTPDQGTGNVGALTDGTSLFTAIQEQLGLKLEPRQAPMNVFVIESAERPTQE
jgi:uncharacterized protein (TIGR03435 family)